VTGGIPVAEGTLHDFHVARRSSQVFGTGLYFVSSPERLSAASKAVNGTQDLAAFLAHSQKVAGPLFCPRDSAAVTRVRALLIRVNNAVQLHAALPAETGTQLVLDLRAEGIVVPAGAFMRHYVETRSDLLRLMSLLALPPGTPSAVSQTMDRPTLATRIMAAAGFSGVDVRHLPAYDIQGAGSVIYATPLPSIAPQSN